MFDFLKRREQDGFRDVPVETYRSSFNETDVRAKYVDNGIITYKYNVVTFLPRALFEQFRRLANVYFLIISILMIIGTYTDLFESPIEAYSTLGPLIIMLAIIMAKEGFEDLKRHKSDHEINNRTAKVIDWKQPGQFVDVKWKDLMVGQLVMVEHNGEMPADLILLATNDPNGLAYVETSNIDGETNLKVKNSAPTQIDGSGPMFHAPQDFHNFPGKLKYETPNPRIHFFTGTLQIMAESGAIGREVAISAQQLMLRGSSIRNTRWAVGVVVYTGHDTKMIQNSRLPPSKLSQLEVTVNWMIYLIFGAQFILTTVSLVAYIIWKSNNYSDLFYLCVDVSDSDRGFYRNNCEDDDDTSDAGMWFTFLILYNNFIPISLYVTVEVVNYVQAYFLEEDREMYDEVTDTAANARTSNLNADLGQISYIFSDKTGTLTQNVMNFKRCSVGGKVFGEMTDEEMESAIKANPDARDRLVRGEGLSKLVDEARADRRSAAYEFILIMGICHTVVIEQGENGAPLFVGNRRVYQAESPDEEALVDAAISLGITFVSRTPNTVEVEHSAGLGGGREVYEVLAVFPFNSHRKRMSVIFRHQPTGRIVCYTKGADNIIFDRSRSFMPGSGSSSSGSGSSGGGGGGGVTQAKRTMNDHLSTFATEGLRTLVLAKREFAAPEWDEWYPRWKEATTTLEGQAEKLEHAAAEVERDLVVVGATAIEDKLQDEVPDTIASLKDAGINIWVLTGDKMETAINIGYSARLLQPDMVMIKIRDREEELGSREAAAKAVQLQLNGLVGHFGRLATDEAIVSTLFQHTSNAENVNDHTGAPVTVVSGDEGNLPRPLLASGGAEGIANGEGEEKTGGSIASGGSGSGGSGTGGGANGSNSSFKRARHTSHFSLGVFDSRGREIEISQLNSSNLALVVDGASLSHVLGDKIAERHFLRIASLCKSVIGCRVSPKQKRLIVRLVRQGIKPQPMTLAIGDGANDVGMIQEAQVGVGISGREGMQAKNNSDFAIAQFRFLKRLLLVHGRWDYRRLSKVIVYSFYKNIVLTLILFFFQFSCGFSAQSLYDDYVYTGYNFFLALPVVAFGCMDKDVELRTVMRFPGLYVVGRKRWDMNNKVMSRCILLAMVDSFVLYYFTYFSYKASGASIWFTNGKGSDLYVYGTTVYSMMLFAMLYRAGFYTYTYTWITWLFYFGGSWLFYFLFLIIYQYLIDYAWQFYGVANEMLSSPVFWLLALLCPTLSVMFDISAYSIKTTFFPSILDIGTEYDRLYQRKLNRGHDDDGELGSEHAYAEEEHEIHHVVSKQDLEFGDGGRMQTAGVEARRKFEVSRQHLDDLNSNLSEIDRMNLGIEQVNGRPMSSYDFDHVANSHGFGGKARYAENNPSEFRQSKGRLGAANIGMGVGTRGGVKDARSPRESGVGARTSSSRGSSSRGPGSPKSPKSPKRGSSGGGKR